MPELPEAETARRTFERNLLNQKIVGIFAEKDPILFDGVSPRLIHQGIVGSTLIGTGRKGKYFWLTFSTNKTLILHLGMTGEISAGKTHPRFLKLSLLGKSSSVHFGDARRLGRVWMTSGDPRFHPRIAKLGDDCFLTPPSAETIFTLTKKRSAPIKSLLLNQRLFAGIGNWIADEVLYHARIAPHRHASTLTIKECRALAKAIIVIIPFAVNAEGDESQFPKKWLFQFRWEKKYTIHPVLKKVIRFDTIGGRTAAWIPQLQK